MTCTYDRELLALYANDDATEEERVLTEAHLASCAECQGVLDQYRLGAGLLSATLRDAAPRHRRKLRTRSWRMAAAAAAVLVALFGMLQVPAMAAQLTRVFPFLTVLELDSAGVSELIRLYTEDRIGKVYYPDVFETVEAAEEAWGGHIPRPTALPAGVEIYRIEMYRSESGRKEVGIYYRDPIAHSSVSWRLSTRPQQRKVPKGATSEVKVNGKPAAVIGGTFAQRPGEPLKWEAKSDTHLFFPVGDLYGDIFTVGEDPDFSLDDLIRFAESVK